MTVTANELLERLPPPAVIQDYSRFMEQQRSRGAGASAEGADPVPMLREFLDRLRVVHEELGTFSIESDEDRAVMREEAAATGRIARVYYDLHTEMIESGLPDSHPVVVLCEEVAAGLEDMAETAALAGSEAFARLVAQEIADARAES